MKVAINARTLSSPVIRGWNRYILNLLAGLVPAGVEPVLYTDRPIHDDHLRRLPPSGRYEVRVAPPMRYVRWEQRWVPRQCGRDRIDVYHCPINFGVPWSCPCPTVLT